MIKAIRIVIFSLVGLVALITVLAFILLEWPLTFVHPSTLAWAEKHFAKKFTGMTFHWSEARVDLNSSSFPEKKLSFLFKDLCASHLPERQVCFKSARFGFAYQFPRVIPKLTELGPLDLIGGRANLNMTQDIANAQTAQSKEDSAKKQKEKKKAYETKQSSESNKASETIELPTWVAQARLLPIRIELDPFLVENTSGFFKGSVRAHYEHSILHAKTTTTFMNQGKPGDGSANLTAANTSGTIEGPWTANAKLNLDFRDRGKVLGEVHLVERTNQRLNYQVNASYQGSFGRTTLRSQGVYRPNRIQGQLEQHIFLSKNAAPGVFPEILSEASQIAIRNCRYQYFQTDRATHRGQIETHCPVFFDLPFSKKRHVNIPTQASTSTLTSAPALASFLYADHPLFTIESRFAVPFPLNSADASQQDITGKIQVVLGHFLYPLIQTAGKLALDISVQPNSPDPLKLFNGAVHFATEVPEFHSIVQRLSGTSLSIPSPLNTLYGPIQAQLVGGFTLRGGSLTLRGNSRLTSPHDSQRLFITTFGNTHIDAVSQPMEIVANADLSLADVRLGLPKFSVGKLPQVLPDPRLRAPQSKSPSQASYKTPSAPVDRKESSPQPQIHYRVKVHTLQPIHIESTLASQPIPIDVNLMIRNPKTIAGSVVIEQFPIQLLGGKKEIKQVTIGLKIQDLQKVPQGQVTVKTPASTTEIAPGQLAGQVAGGPETTASRSAPTFQLPIVKLISSILLGTPLNEIQTAPATLPTPVQSMEKERSQLVQIQRRF